MAIILVLIAVALYAGNVQYLKRIPALLRFRKTVGRVLSVEYYSYPYWGNDRLLEHLKQTRSGSVVTYRYEVEKGDRWHIGKHEIGDLSLGGAIAHLEKGNKFTVFYDPENPANATLHRSPPGGVLLVTLLLALALFSAFR